MLCVEWPEHPKWMSGCTVSDCGRYLFVTPSQGRVTAAVYLFFPVYTGTATSLCCCLRELETVLWIQYSTLNLDQNPEFLLIWIRINFEREKLEIILEENNKNKNKLPITKIIVPELSRRTF